jgi:hypothetical protein
VRDAAAVDGGTRPEIALDVRVSHGHIDGDELTAVKRTVTAWAALSATRQAAIIVGVMHE